MQIIYLSEIHATNACQWAHMNVQIVLVFAGHA
jgi:hypothetical protein